MTVTLSQIAVIDTKGIMYQVGDLVTFKSGFQHGTATVEAFNRDKVTLKGVDVVSKWGQKMVSGNAIMGHISLITGKA